MQPTTRATRTSLLSLGLAAGLLLIGPGQASAYMVEVPPAGMAMPPQLSRPTPPRPPTLPPQVPPQPSNDARARQVFREGTQQFSAGRYEQALVSFQSAYALSPRPPLLYNIAVCQERLNRPQEAIATYRYYLASTPGSPMQSQIQQTIARLEAQAAAQPDDQATSADMEVADPEGGMAVPEELLDPNEPETGSDRAEQNSSPRPRTSGRFGVSLAGYVLALAGGVSVAAFGGLALANDSSSSDGCSLTDPCSAATMGMVVGLGIAGAGLIWGTTALVLELLGVSDLGSDHGASAALVPWAHPEGGGLAISGRF